MPEEEIKEMQQIKEAFLSLLPDWTAGQKSYPVNLYCRAVCGSSRAFRSI